MVNARQIMQHNFKLLNKPTMLKYQPLLSAMVEVARQKPTPIFTHNLEFMGHKHQGKAQASMEENHKKSSSSPKTSYYGHVNHQHMNMHKVGSILSNMLAKMLWWWPNQCCKLYPHKGESFLEYKNCKSRLTKSKR